MKRLGIGALILFGMLLICEKASLANLTDSSPKLEAATYGIDDRVPIEQFLREIDTAGAANTEIDAGNQTGGHFFEAKADGVHDTAASLTAFNDGSVPNWIAMLAFNHRNRSEKSFDDASGRHGFLDSGGTVVTLTDPRDGGGTVTIGINSNGQIVGNVYDWTHARGFLPKPRIADTPEPNALPLLGGCLSALAIAFHRKRNRSRYRRAIRLLA